eukprot:4246073-Amphidinium_carterae.1
MTWGGIKRCANSRLSRNDFNIKIAYQDVQLGSSEDKKLISDHSINPGVHDLSILGLMLRLARQVGQLPGAEPDKSALMRARLLQCALRTMLLTSYSGSHHELLQATTTTSHRESQEHGSASCSLTG